MERATAACEGNGEKENGEKQQIEKEIECRKRKK